jgi:hypothetical protein
MLFQTAALIYKEYNIIEGLWLLSLFEADYCINK